MRAELIYLFDRPGAAFEARRELRALQKELRLGRIASVAVVTRPARDGLHLDQDGDVGVGAGARFGLVAGALLGALLLAPFAGVYVAVAAREGLAAAQSADDWIAALALVVALVSGLTALLAALGGALLGAVAAALLNFGIPARRLTAIGEGLEPGQAALVLRVREEQRPPVVDLLALSGGAPVRLRDDAQSDTASDEEVVAASFTSRAVRRCGSGARTASGAGRPGDATGRPAAARPGGGRVR